jgi:hypothetical protein
MVEFLALRGNGSQIGAYTPCSVRLQSGQIVPCVVLVEKSAARDLPAFGPRGLGLHYHYDDTIMIDLAGVASIQPSPFRIPVDIEMEMRRHGQTHPAGYLVRFVYNDGMKYWHASDESLWFASAPEGRLVKDVSSVEFPTIEEYNGVWSRETILKSPAFKWCVYDDRESRSRSR